jgi:hypothetical protein
LKPPGRAIGQLRKDGVGNTVVIDNPFIGSSGLAKVGLVPIAFALIAFIAKDLQV